MKINKFRGEPTDVSAKKDALKPTILQTRTSTLLGATLPPWYITQRHPLLSSQLLFTYSLHAIVGHTGIIGVTVITDTSLFAAVVGLGAGRKDAFLASIATYIASCAVDTVQPREAFTEVSLAGIRGALVC